MLHMATMAMPHSSDPCQEHCLELAASKRTSLAVDQQTTAYRLVDGGGDGFPGVVIEVFDRVWLVSTRGKQFPAWLREPREGVRGLYWKQLDRDEKEAPQWIWGEQVNGPFHVLENGMKIELSMQAGYSQGIFLDQRLNRSRVRDRVKPGQRVLNTFSYTCAFSVAAALAGAITTSLDLSNPYLQWGKRNFEANGLDPASQYFCKGDAMSWMKRFAKQKRLFTGIILDPPTFSRSDAGVFRVQKDYDRLVQAAAQIVELGGWVLATCNDRRLEHDRFEVMVREGVRLAGRRVATLAHTSMPPDFTGEHYLKSIWVDLA